MLFHTILKRHLVVAVSISISISVTCCQRKGLQYSHRCSWLNSDVNFFQKCWNHFQALQVPVQKIFTGPQVTVVIQKRVHFKQIRSIIYKFSLYFCKLACLLNTAMIYGFVKFYRTSPWPATLAKMPFGVVTLNRKFWLISHRFDISFAMALKTYFKA